MGTIACICGAVGCGASTPGSCESESESGPDSLIKDGKEGNVNVFRLNNFSRQCQTRINGSLLNRVFFSKWEPKISDSSQLSMFKTAFRGQTKNHSECT